MYDAGPASDAHPTEAKQITDADQPPLAEGAMAVDRPVRARKALPGRLRKKIARQKTTVRHNA